MNKKGVSQTIMIILLAILIISVIGTLSFLVFKSFQADNANINANNISDKNTQVKDNSVSINGPDSNTQSNGICIPGGKRCSEKELQECTSDGLNWQTNDLCDANEKCTLSGCILETCSEQGGDICSSSEICYGNITTSSNSNSCCSVSCIDKFREDSKNNTNVLTQERSAWLEMSLTDTNKRYCTGYYDTVEECSRPSNFCNSNCNPLPRDQINNSVNLLKDYYHINTIYLVYHEQFSISNYKTNLEIWKEESDKIGLRVIPSYVLYTYGTNKPNFNNSEISDIVEYSTSLFGMNIGIFDINPNPTTRNYTSQLDFLKSKFPEIVIDRFGVQPHESSTLLKNIDNYLYDDYSYVAGCFDNTDWQNRNALRLVSDYIPRINSGGKLSEMAFITVGGNYNRDPSNECYVADTCIQYQKNISGRCVGYDDGSTNDPNPLGRNILAAKKICSTVSQNYFRGFTNDFYILEVSSTAVDSQTQKFATSLKQGKPYLGKFSAPLEEIKNIFKLQDLCSQSQLDSLLQNSCHFDTFNDLNNTLGLHYNSWDWVSTLWKTVPGVNDPFKTDTRFTCLNGRYYNCNFDNKTASWTNYSNDCQKIGDYYCDYTTANWVIKKPSRCS